MLNPMTLGLAVCMHRHLFPHTFHYLLPDHGVILVVRVVGVSQLSWTEQKKRMIIYSYTYSCHLGKGSRTVRTEFEL